jgi:hypothetical protein
VIDTYELRLTYAELDYLVANDPRWPDVAASLGLNNARDRRQSAEAGVASLLARQLAHIEHREVVVDNSVLAFAARLVAPSDAAMISLVHEDEVAGGLFLVSGQGRTLVSLVAPGVLGFVGLGEAEPPSRQLAGLIHGVLEGDAAYAVVSHGDRTILVSQKAATWSVASQPDPAEGLDPTKVDDWISAKLNDFGLQKVSTTSPREPGPRQ